MIKALISDFDGVLFDSQPYHFEAANCVFNELDLKLSYELYQNKYIGLTDYAIIKDFLILNGYSATADQINSLIFRKMFFYKKILDDYESLEPITGVTQFLEEAKNHISKFAICSNANRQDLELVLKKLDGGKLQKHFQFTVTSNDVEQGKPEPDGYLKAARLLAVEPEFCLVIEDSKSGIAAGKKAGMQVVGLTTSHAPEGLQEADYIAKSYVEIGSWLSNMIKLK